MNDELDQKLARIAGRMEAQRATVRSQLQTRPELLATLAAIKETLGGKLKWLRIGDFEQGQEPEAGVTVNAAICSKPQRRKRRPHR